MALKIRRGTEAQRTSTQLALGEIVWTTDTYKLYVGDGIAAGGHNIAQNLAGIGMVFNAATNRLDINYNGLNSDAVSEGNNNLFFTPERAQQAAGTALVAGNGHNVGITFTYDDVNARFTAEIDTSASLPAQGGHIGEYLTTNGTTASWSAIPASGISDVQSDTTPTLGGNLTLNSHNITGTGNINISGSVTATAITAGGITFNTTATISGTTINETAIHNFITNTPSATQHVSLLSASSDTFTGPLTLGKARGSFFSPVTVQSGDSISKVVAAAFTGSAFTSVGEIECQVSGVVSSGIAPSTWGIKAQNAAGSLVTAVSINAQAVTFAVAPTVPSYANDSARDVAITAPARGMIIINGTSFQGWNGTSWATLG